MEYTEVDTYNTLKAPKIEHFGDLKGCILSDVVVTEDEVHLRLSPTLFVKLYHDQDCCEHVYVESVVGDVQDLVGAPLLLAEESSQNNPDATESGTWTFYKLATSKGYVDIRFCGESNGYYSESVSVEVIRG